MDWTEAIGVNILKNLDSTIDKYGRKAIIREYGNNM